MSRISSISEGLSACSATPPGGRSASAPVSRRRRRQRGEHDHLRRPKASTPSCGQHRRAPRRRPDPTISSLACAGTLAGTAPFSPADFPRSNASSIAWDLTASVNWPTSLWACSSSQLRSLARRPGRAANAANAASFTVRRNTDDRGHIDTVPAGRLGLGNLPRGHLQDLPLRLRRQHTRAADELRSRSLTTPLRFAREPARVVQFAAPSPRRTQTQNRPARWLVFF